MSEPQTTAAGAGEVPLLQVEWVGQTYSSADLTVADIIELEDEFGTPLMDIDWRHLKAQAWLVWLVRRADEPALELAAVTKERIEAVVRPRLLPAEDRAGTPVEQPAPAGSRGSRASTASRRGTSGD